MILVLLVGYERILLELYRCCTGTLPEVIKDDEHSSKTFNVMKSPHIQRCLAVQQMIDHGDDDAFATFGVGIGSNMNNNSSARLNRLRTIPAKSASIMVGVRIIFYAVHIIQSSGTDRAADTVHSLVGIFRWFLYVVTMLLEDLLRVRERVVSSGGKEALDSATAVRAAIYEENTPVMAVLLGSTPRALMKLCSYYIRNLLDRNGIKGVINSTSSARSFEKILRPLFDSAPIRLKDFERLLDEMNHHVRQAYDNTPLPQQPNAVDSNSKKQDSGESSKTGPMPDPQRLATERLFLITGDFPDLLFPVAHRLLTHTLDRITTPVDDGGYGLDRIRILEADMRFLGLTDEPRAITFQKRNRFDVLRQVCINGLRSWRRCTRCGACMEDLMPGQCAVWVRNLGMKCTCGNPWVVQERKT